MCFKGFAVKTVISQLNHVDRPFYERRSLDGWEEPEHNNSGKLSQTTSPSSYEQWFFFFSLLYILVTGASHRKEKSLTHHSVWFQTCTQLICSWNVLRGNINVRVSGWRHFLERFLQPPFKMSRKKSDDVLMRFLTRDRGESGRTQISQDEEEEAVHAEDVNVERRVDSRWFGDKGRISVPVITKDLMAFLLWDVLPGREQILRTKSCSSCRPGSSSAARGSLRCWSCSKTWRRRRREGWNRSGGIRVCRGLSWIVGETEQQRMKCQWSIRPTRSRLWWTWILQIQRQKTSSLDLRTNKQDGQRREFRSNKNILPLLNNNLFIVNSLFSEAKMEKERIKSRIFSIVYTMCISHFIYIHIICRRNIFDLIVIFQHKRN